MHKISWGRFLITLTRGEYRVELDGARLAAERLSDVDGAPLPLGACLARALACVQELADARGAELPDQLPARAHAIARWF